MVQDPAEVIVPGDPAGHGIPKREQSGHWYLHVQFAFGSQCGLWDLAAAAASFH